MKVIAQGDPIEYEVEDAADACRLYRKDMTAALIGVVTSVTDYERAQRNAESVRLMNASYQELHAAYKQVRGAGDELLAACDAAYNALRSYQHGNTAPELAQEIADHLQEVIAKTHAS